MDELPSNKSPTMGNIQDNVASNGHDIIVIGASHGGIEALSLLMGTLPADLAASVFVVQHVSPQVPSHLPEILSRRGSLPASHPHDGEEFQPGRVYIAPPDRHLLVEDGRVRVGRGPRENLFRPAVDVLFRSAALAHGPRVIGVVLTAALDNGTAGLWAVKHHGGIAVVQDPSEAQHASMPESALEYVDVDHCLPVAEMGPLLGRLAREEAPAADPAAVAAPTRIADAYVSLMTGRARAETQGITMAETQGPPEGAHSLDTSAQSAGSRSGRSTKMGSCASAARSAMASAATACSLANQRRSARHSGWQTKRSARVRCWRSATPAGRAAVLSPIWRRSSKSAHACNGDEPSACAASSKRAMSPCR